MVSGGIHERPRKHGHAADVLPPGLGVLLIGAVNAVGGLADVHDILPGQHGIDERADFFIPAAAAQGAVHRLCGQGQQHHRRGDLRHVPIITLVLGNGIFL